MKILNWNTKLCDQSQADVLQYFLEEKRPDVVLLQEVGSASAISTYLGALQTDEWAVLTAKEGFGGKNYYVVFSKKYITSIPNQLTRFDPRSDPSCVDLRYPWSDSLFGSQNGRSPVYADIEYLDSKFRIANWHAPHSVHTTGELSRVLKGGTNLESLVGLDSSDTFNPTKNDCRLILGGDFNVHQSDLNDNWRIEMPDIPIKSGGIKKQKKTTRKPKTIYMKHDDLFHHYTSICPSYGSNVEHILFSFKSKYDLYLMKPGETETNLNGTIVQNGSDHTLMLVKFIAL
ncbi:endonuclease/exonuclease/phosphatase family protein [Metapseudomonas otitidis]|uniref:endonuclease/exonuclease/phosphatase family protein n=1 Tax=Metapseudomonas otitidis TaxID=319939 RepID=UPI0013F62430|nr:endonuclease/exonuclease/phosphatase family protein [Pseudomonas otitidis]